MGRTTRPSPRGWVRLGVALLLLAAVAARLAVEAVGAWGGLGGPGWGPDDVVVAVAATAGTLVAAVLLVGVLTAAAALRAGPALRPPLVPALVHRGTAVVLGVTLAAGAPAASPAVDAIDPGWRPTTPITTTTTGQAAAPVRSDPATPTDPVEPAPDPGWRPTATPPVPARTVAEPIDPVLLSGARQPADERVLVTVRRGDTLWDLAARGLGSTASDAEIAAEWPRWYAANRDVVGADPDLLVPGQQLVPPADHVAGPDG